MFKSISILATVLLCATIMVSSEWPSRSARQSRKISEILQSDRFAELKGLDYFSHRVQVVRTRRQLFSTRINLPSTTTPTTASVIECIRNCPVTAEYNPLCGTDGVQYSNPGALSCAIYCTNSRIKIKHFGSCDPTVRS